MDLSTNCQLRCPGCSTTAGIVQDHLGTGTLGASVFASFLDANPQIKSVEVANWGEIFLNKDLPKIARSAFDRGVRLSAETGVNLNYLSDEAADAIVRYRFGTIVVSIDGASPETYAQYRIAGDLDQVFENIKRINAIKERLNSPLPMLIWQFIVFNHNRHEIEQARQMAEQLGMGFYLKPNQSEWETAPPEEPGRTEDARQTPIRGPLARMRKRIQGTACLQMWEQPQITWDGTLTGCNCNTGALGNYGNAFEDGLNEIVNGERMRTARSMLMGKIGPRSDIPCTSCSKFQVRLRENNWVTPLDIGIRRIIGLIGPRMLSAPRLYVRAKTAFLRHTRWGI